MSELLTNALLQGRGDAVVTVSLTRRHLEVAVSGRDPLHGIGFVYL